MKKTLSLTRVAEAKLKDSVAPPPSKDDIIKAMALRTQQQRLEAVRKFDQTCKELNDEVERLLEGLAANYDPKTFVLCGHNTNQLNPKTRQWEKDKLQVAYFVDFTPEIKAAVKKLEDYRKKNTELIIQRRAHSEYLDLACITRELRQQMANDATRSLAILSDPENVKVIDGLLAKLKRSELASTPSIEIA